MFGTLTLHWDDSTNTYTLQCSQCGKTETISYDEFSMSVIAKHLEE